MDLTNAVNTKDLAEKINMPHAELVRHVVDFIGELASTPGLSSQQKGCRVWFEQDMGSLFLNRAAEKALLKKITAALWPQSLTETLQALAQAAESLGDEPDAVLFIDEILVDARALGQSIEMLEEAA